MSKADAEIAVRRETAAKTAIAKVLAERKRPADATLAEIEQSALAAGAEVQQAIAAELAQESATALPPWPDCPACGRKMKTKGKRRRRMVTEAGEIEIERVYYHCGACGQGLFPPGSALGPDGEQL